MWIMVVMLKKCNCVGHLICLLRNVHAQSNYKKNFENITSCLKTNDVIILLKIMQRFFLSSCILRKNDLCGRTNLSNSQI